MLFKRKNKRTADLLKENVPNHIAFICDGNRRWARSKGLPTLLGHKEGVETGKIILQRARELEIKHVTFFCMSTENFKRSKEEVDYLIELFKGFRIFKKCLRDKGYKFQHVGDKSILSNDVLEVIDDLTESTKNCSFGTVYFAFGYGGRNDIINATKKIIASGDKDVDEETFKKYLSTDTMPDVDLLVRPGGEQRISGFLLYNMAYAELLFIDKYWPEFRAEDVDDCVREYQKRSRRFGK